MNRNGPRRVNRAVFAAPCSADRLPRSDASLRARPRLFPVLAAGGLSEGALLLPCRDGKLETAVADAAMTA